jgi:hypothetical protein
MEAQKAAAAAQEAVKAAEAAQAAVEAASGAATVTRLRSMSKLAVTLTPGLLTVLTVPIDPFKLGNVQANWAACDSLMNYVSRIVNDYQPDQLKSLGWSASDSREFTMAAAHYGGVSSAVQSLFNKIESNFDSFNDAIRAYWVEVAIVTVALAAVLAVLMVAQLCSIPGAIYARLQMNWTGAVTSLTLAMMTSRLAKVLEIISVILVSGAAGLLQLHNVIPTAKGALDFTQAELNWTAPARGQWIEPAEYTVTNPNSTTK